MEMSTVFQYRYILLCLLLAVFHASADSLTLSYDGNRLTGVTEAAADYDVTGSFEYKRARGSQYLYDSNGSLVADKSRGIVYITYDVNGNPSGIYFTNGNVTKYLYSASGQKLRSVYYTAMPYITRTFGVQPPELEQWQTQYADSTDYLLGGSLVMKNGRIDKCYFDGGYARAMSTGSTTDRFVFYYYNKDHLGNNREVVDIKARFHQVTGYYPFGAPYADPAAVSGAEHQPYKYNGKELDLMHGLNTYDYGARQYDPILARWDKIDPLCEKYYNVSPYAYCAGNPVNKFDPDGREVYLFSTSLPGASWVPFATHTFLVVQDAKGRITYAAYGPKNNDAISGIDALSKCSYSSDIKAYTDYIYCNKKSDHVKGVELIPVPGDMKSDEFDSKVIDVINSFGNNPNIKYNLYPTREDEGNCNSSSSTILLKAGVSKETIEGIGEGMKGIHWGFSSTAKPWTEEEQEAAIENEGTKRVEENNRLDTLQKTL